MQFNFASTDAAAGDALVSRNDNGRWGVDSEYGRLTDVMLSPPRHLELVPCNSVSIENHGNGVTCCADTAALQHQRLVGALEAEGVRCHVVPPVEGLADLCFTRDATLMTPWGLLALSPAVEHRLAEVAHIRASASGWDIPLPGVVERGRIEGGDVCLLRPGVVAIGVSGDRTDEEGALALARIFEERGWRAILTPFDARYLHLDTIITMLDRSRAVACVELLDDAFLIELRRLGIECIPATIAEVRRLGANLLSLGGGRILSPADNGRINAELVRLGYEVVEVEIDQFTRCGGGMHCLTMPLSRLPA